jgi:hypothetical protein
MSDGSRGFDSQTRPAPGNSTSTGNTLLNGLLGGIVGGILSFVPLSTVLGGGVAGYLEGGDYAAGAKVGAIAGLVAAVPFALVWWLVVAVLSMVSIPLTGALWTATALVFLFAIVYVVGLSVLGGILGVYVRAEVLPTDSFR